MCSAHAIQSHVPAFRMASMPVATLLSMLSEASCAECCRGVHHAVSTAVLVIMPVKGFEASSERCAGALPSDPRREVRW